MSSNLRTPEGNHLHIYGLWYYILFIIVFVVYIFWYILVKLIKKNLTYLERPFSPTPPADLPPTPFRPFNATAMDMALVIVAAGGPPPLAVATCPFVMRSIWPWTQLTPLLLTFLVALAAAADLEQLSRNSRNCCSATCCWCCCSCSWWCLRWLLRAGSCWRWLLLARAWRKSGLSLSLSSSSLLSPSLLLLLR